MTKDDFINNVLRFGCCLGFVYDFGVFLLGGEGLRSASSDPGDSLFMSGACSTCSTSFTASKVVGGSLETLLLLLYLSSQRYDMLFYILMG